MTIGLVIITFIAFLTIIFSIFTFQTNFKSKLTTNVYNQLSDLSTNNAASINSKITDQFTMMTALASYLSDKDLRSAEVNEMTIKTVETYGYLRCAITFPDGSFATHDNKNGGNTIKSEHVINGFQGKNSITGPQPAIVDPTRTVILLTVPIFRDGAVIACLTCTYETEYLDSVFQMTNFNGQGYSYITDKNGNIISKPNLATLIYDGSNILDYFKEQFGNSHEYVEIIETMMNEGVGATILPVDNDQKFVNYQPLGINDWYIFSIAPSSILNQQLNNLFNDILLLSITIIVIFILLFILISSYIGIAQKKSKKELTQLAYYDSLTKLPNKHYFEKIGSSLLQSNDDHYAYVILNVNKFKTINERFGFIQGDQLLIWIGDKLTQCLNKGEICSRFNSDNFHMLLHYNQRQDLTLRIKQLLQICETYDFRSLNTQLLSYSCGVVPIINKQKPISLMGDKALIALSKIKGAHSSQICFYDDELAKHFDNEQNIENKMKKALNEGEMKLYLQPQNSVATHEIVGAEALVRWIESSGKLIMPDQFIPLFEKNGFILELDMYMIEQSCKVLKEWRDEGLRVIPISVNQSRACLYQSDYLQRLKAILDRYSIEPNLIELEVTERAFFEDETALINVIHDLHTMGFKVAMDDFGAGYSSLNMLQDVEVDILKLDKNFFKESINSKRGQKIVRSIVSMANELLINVVAEGIETSEQLDFLSKIGCAYVQGYYFSKPVGVESFKEMLNNGIHNKVNDDRV